MDVDVLRESLKLAFDLPDNHPKLEQLARQLDLLLAAHTTGQDVDGAFVEFLKRADAA